MGASEVSSTNKKAQLLSLIHILLACRHIGISEKDEEKMLRKIGVGSLDELIDKTIPANIRLKEPLALPEPMTEYEFGQHITRLACKNKLYTTYIGLG